MNFAERVKGPYLAGEQLTTADLAIAPFVGRLYLLEEHRRFTIHKKHEKLKGSASSSDSSTSLTSEVAWIEEIEKVDSYKKTLSDRVRYEQLYNRYLSDVAMSEAARAVRSGGAFP